MSKMTIIYDRDPGDENDFDEALVDAFLHAYKRLTPSKVVEDDEVDPRAVWPHRVFYRDDD